MSPTAIPIVADVQFTPSSSEYQFDVPESTQKTSRPICVRANKLDKFYIFPLTGFSSNFMFESADAGVTWSIPSTTGAPTGGARLVAYFEDAGPSGVGRFFYHTGGAAISYSDDGLAWSQSVTVFTGTSGSAIARDPGTGRLVFCVDSGTIEIGIYHYWL